MDRLHRLALRLVWLAGVATLTSCYSPSLRDCTVSCAKAGDCAGDQLCGSDGLCAAPDVAGHCAAADAGGTGDGSSGAVSDAGMPDAPAMIELRVQITGKGSIVVDGHGTCSSMGPQKGDCTYTIPARVAQTVHAVAIQPNELFKDWTSTVCKDAPELCTFTPTAATTVVAEFTHFGQVQ